MKIILDKKWIKVLDKEKQSKHNNTEIKKYNISQVIQNEDDTYIEWVYEEKIEITDKKIKSLDIKVDEYICNSGGMCLYINGFFVPINGRLNMPLNPPIKLEIRVKVLAQSDISLKSISLVPSYEERELTEELNVDCDVLVVTPDYPSVHNLYMCGFVHSRVREYLNEGLKVQVAAISSNWYQCMYEINGVSVFKGNFLSLKKMLEKKIYKVIVTHFVCDEYYEVFDGYIQDERLIFICHGPETIFDILPNISRHYFTRKIDNEDFKHLYKYQRNYIKKYAEKENVTWVFVSEWLKNCSEQLLNLKFKNSTIIHNIINEKLFPYHKKNKEDRKKILILRKFDNIIQHSIDQSILAIRELSRRDVFKELEFNIYGDGNYFDELVEPIKEFSNVNIKRGFIPNEKISELHKQNGILLIPSRYDSQGVAMCEGAASGMVVVGSNVTTVPFFMNEEENHTLADPENYIELADIIEELYNNPDKFLEISERMSRHIMDICSLKNTLHKEIQLIEDKLNENRQYISMGEKKNPVLTITVPAYNIEQYVDKCLYSLINHNMNEYLEILLVNDGSKDATVEKTEAFIKKYGAKNIRLINKENGGHGSTINVGIREAKGKYFRLIDGDDWVDSDNLAKQIELLLKTDVDLMLTKGCYEYIEQERLANIIDYDFMTEGVIYNFEDLTYPNYGFSNYGPLLTTATYKTELLRKANFKISEKKPYVDMEFNAFSLKYINTVVHYQLDIYRYLIGRVGQTISRDFWKKKYKDHEEIIFNLCNYVITLNSEERKKKYIIERLIARMIDSQVFMFDQVTNWEELEKFLGKLQKYPEVYKAGLKYIDSIKHDSSIILKHYKSAISHNKNISYEKREPIINEDDTINKKYCKNSSIIQVGKRMAKWIVPYEIAIRISKMLH